MNTEFQGTQDAWESSETQRQHKVRVLGMTVKTTRGYAFQSNQNLLSRQKEGSAIARSRNI